jgi:hypothetical protein
MNLIYQVVINRSGEDATTLIVTVDRMIAINKARDYNGHQDWDRAHVAAWIDGEHNWAYVDLETAELFDYADHGGRYPVVTDFSFAANPPSNRIDKDEGGGPDEWVE